MSMYVYLNKLPVLLNPNWPQITFASLVPNLVLQTLPQALLIHTSTRPRVLFAPPTNLTSPRLQLPAKVDDSRNAMNNYISHVAIMYSYEYVLTLTYNPSNSPSNM